MKTMIANAEKLEKLGDLIEVEGTKTTLGGSLEIDGELRKSDAALTLIFNANGTASFNANNIDNNTLYAINIEGYTGTIFIKDKGSIAYSSVFFHFDDSIIFFMEYSSSSPTTSSIAVYKTDGNEATELEGWQVNIIPIISMV